MLWNEAVMLLFAAIIWTYVEVDAHTKNNCIKLDAVKGDSLVKFGDDLVKNISNLHKKVIDGNQRATKLYNQMREEDPKLMDDLLKLIQEIQKGHLFLPSFIKKMENINQSDTIVVAQNVPCDICMKMKWSDKIFGFTDYTTKTCITHQQYCSVKQVNTRDMLKRRKWVEFYSYDPKPTDAECQTHNKAVDDCSKTQVSITKEEVEEARTYAIAEMTSAVPTDVFEEVGQGFAYFFRWYTVLHSAITAKTKYKKILEWGETFDQANIKWEAFVQNFLIQKSIQEWLPCNACGSMEMVYQDAAGLDKTLQVSQCMTQFDYCVFRLISEVPLSGNDTIGSLGRFQMTDVSANPNAKICEFAENVLGGVRQKRATKKQMAKNAQVKKQTIIAAFKADTDATKKRLATEAKQSYLDVAANTGGGTSGLAGIGLGGTGGIIVLLQKLH